MPASTRWISTVFFTSGFAALLYQVVWQRALFTVWGTNSESVTIVVAAFMLGLGVGSLAGGRYSRNADRNLLAAFAVIELCIGVVGLVSLPVIRALAVMGESLVVAGLVSFALILIPTALMGATLPILIAHSVRVFGNVGKATANLYFVNTLGSAAASFAASMVLLGLLGQSGTVAIAASLNLVLGGTFLAHVRRSRTV